MSLVGEKAIIVWDSERKLEHFVRLASFEGDAKDFGFIVPAPTEPKVSEAKSEAFSKLEEFVSEMVSKRGSGMGCSAPLADGVAAGAELIDQYLVGDYEVSVLKATDGKSMLDWLESNEYTSRPAMEGWLDHYAKMGWYFAALKFVRPENAETEETSAVRVSFQTDVPFYPYKMPEDTWPKDHFRPIALYFVSSGIARGQYRNDNKDWEADIAWSGSLPREEAMALASSIGLTPDDVPEAAMLTVFNNSKNAQGYDKDLFFLTYSSVLPTWAVLLIFLLIAGGITLAYVRRRASRNQDLATG